MRLRGTHLGAGVLAGASTLYLILSLAMGRSARSELPPDLSAGADAGLDVWKTAALLLDGGLLVDVRPDDELGRYHPPCAVHAPDADAAALRSLAHGAAVVVLAGKDAAAQKLVGEARAADPAGRYFFLQDGSRAWYLALELPVPLFAEGPAPRGYDDAVATLKGWLAKPDPAARARALAAVQTLAKASYQPSLLKTGGKPKAAGGARKKISGGCG